MTEESDAEPGGPVVLVVDDVQANLDLIVRALEPFGFRVVTAIDAEQAYARACATRPSLILCDVRLRPTDGSALIERVKNDPNLSSTPFLFIASTE